MNHNPNEWHNTYHLLTEHERLTLYKQALDYAANRHRRWYQAPLVQVTIVLLVLATAASIIWLPVNGIPQTVLLLWGAYVLSLNLLIIQRTIRKGLISL